MTWGEFSACVEGYQLRLEDQMRLTDIANHTLGHYVAVAFHNPKKYPKKPFLERDKPRAKLSDAGLDAFIEAEMARVSK